MCLPEGGEKHQSILIQTKISSIDSLLFMSKEREQIVMPDTRFQDWNFVV